MRLGDIARPVYERRHARAREQRGLGPEVDRVADRQPEFVGQVARGEAAVFRAGDVAAAEEHRLQARDLAEALGLPIGNAVDFWTEASLFSAAGMTAMVYGPGDIAQAHTADEWVSLEQLQRYGDSVVRILGAGLDVGAT